MWLKQGQVVSIEDIALNESEKFTLSLEPENKSFTWALRFVNKKECRCVELKRISENQFEVMCNPYIRDRFY